jgi:protein-S-isoprenylcysteine O-methyltransferase Ste14
MIRWVVFAVVSLVLARISWKPLQNPRSHGFYRFFAWEAILGLFLMNVNFWFYEPFAWNQIIAWSLLLMSLVPLALGVYSLRTRGKPARQRDGDSTLLAFERTTTLVTGGIYHYIRHPLYSSLLLLTWGIFFKFLSVAGTALAALATLLLVATARADETECARFFGPAYEEYMQKTKMFVPYVF